MSNNNSSSLANWILVSLLGLSIFLIALTSTAGAFPAAPAGRETGRFHLGEMSVEKNRRPKGLVSVRDIREATVYVWGNARDSAGKRITEKVECFYASGRADTAKPTTKCTNPGPSSRTVTPTIFKCGKELKFAVKDVPTVDGPHMRFYRTTASADKEFQKSAYLINWTLGTLLEDLAPNIIFEGYFPGYTGYAGGKKIYDYRFLRFQYQNKHPIKDHWAYIISVDNKLRIDTRKKKPLDRNDFGLTGTCAGMQCVNACFSKSGKADGSGFLINGCVDDAPMGKLRCTANGFWMNSRGCKRSASCPKRVRGKASPTGAGTIVGNIDPGRTANQNAFFDCDGQTCEVDEPLGILAVDTNPVINCDLSESDCEEDAFTEDESITLTATPEPGYSFLKWGGNCPCAESTDPECIFDHVTTQNDPAYDIEIACEAYFHDVDCGNSVLDTGEECDDGNNDGGDGCSAACTLELCGNGVLEGGEECDDGNAEDGDGCTTACQTAELAECGNGVLESGEECDDGNYDNEDGCSSSCMTDFCGDGFITPSIGEQCDDRNNEDGDGCGATCMLEYCGDGTVQNSDSYTEECDDGNTDDGDGCNSNCMDEVSPLIDCGNGILEGVEQCDDGNNDLGDGCDQYCNSEDPASTCGDGFVEALEQCDDGNTDPGDGCDEWCFEEPVSPSPHPSWTWTPSPEPSPEPSSSPSISPSPGV